MSDVKGTVSHLSGCCVCGNDLVYTTEPAVLTCSYCGTSVPTEVSCTAGHYVCDTCHQRDALSAMHAILVTTVSDAPQELLELVVHHPRVPMHGPEHHAIVPAVLVAAARHAGYAVSTGALERAIQRGSSVPGGWCGSHGSCGAGIGVGVAVSLLTGATPLTGAPRSLANEATALVLGRLADGHPRCCKRASRIAVAAGTEFLRDRLEIPVRPGGCVACRDVVRNRECVRAACPHYVPHGYVHQMTSPVTKLHHATPSA